MSTNNPFIKYKIYSTPKEISLPHTHLHDNVKVACLVFSEENDKLPFLKKILKASKVPEDDYQIILLDPYSVISAADLHWFGQLEYILSFGIPASTAGIFIPNRLYTFTSIRNIKIALIPDLQTIEGGKSEKQKLWQMLKNEFLNE